jgi:hypothetical protein
MQLRGIFLARFAEVGHDGLFTAVGGGIDAIQTGGFPWAWGLMYLLCQIRLTKEEAIGEHVQVIERETPDGQIEPLLPGTPMMQMPATAHTGPDGNVGLTISFPLYNSIFPRAGVYKYRFKIDDQAVGVAELLVTGPEQGGQHQ